MMEKEIEQRENNDNNNNNTDDTMKNAKRMQNNAVKQFKQPKIKYPKL